MNPWELSASDLMIWGLVLHLIADWPLQNDWMANCKMKRRIRRGLDNVVVPSPWWDRHLAAYIHASIHGFLLSIVFGWAAIPLAITHLLIDTRTPVVWWSRLIEQTQPLGKGAPIVDIGLEVRIWTDQVFHIFCIAIAALLVTL